MHIVAGVYGTGTHIGGGFLAENMFWYTTSSLFITSNWTWNSFGSYVKLEQTKKAHKIR